MADNTNQTTKVITGKVRASYVHIFQPQSIDGNDQKFQCQYHSSLIRPKPIKKQSKSKVAKQQNSR